MLDSFTERSIDFIFGNEDAFYAFGEYVTGLIIPPMLPSSFGTPQDALHSVLGNTIVGGISDIGFNKDFKGTPIESGFDQNLMSNEKYNENTSKIAYALGQTKLAMVNEVSPKQIDHFISSYTGILGQVNKALFPTSKERSDYSIGLRNKFITDSAYSTDVINKIYDIRDQAQIDFEYENNIESAVTYEQNCLISDYVSEMNKAIKAMPEEKQRDGRQYLLQKLSKWNYGDTKAQKKMLDKFEDDTVSEDYITTKMPDSKLEWTENKQKYSYQMTPKEYNEYASEFLKMLDNYRVNASKSSSKDNYIQALDGASAAVKREINPKYKEKFKKKAEKIDK